MGAGADQDAIARELARTYGVPAVRRAHLERVDAALIRQLPAQLARKHQAVPVALTAGDAQELVVAMRDPTDVAAVDEIGFLTGARIRVAVAPPELIAEFLDRFYGAVPAIQLPAPAPAASRFEPRPDDGDALELGVELPPRSAPPPIIAGPVLAQPQPVEVPPARAFRAGGGGGSSWLIKVVSSVLGLVAGWWVVDRLACNADPSPVDVGGKPYYADNVHMDMVLPPGWFYAPAEDRSESGGGVTQHMSMFYRGGTAEDPDYALVLASANTKGALPIPAPPKLFDEMLRGLQRGGTQSSYDMTTRLRDCRPSSARSEQTGECDGTAVYRGKSRNVKLYLWLDPSGWICVAAYLSAEPSAEMQYELVEILTNLHLRR